MRKLIVDCKIRLTNENELPLRTDINIEETLKYIISETLGSEFDFVVVKDLVYREKEIK